MADIRVSIVLGAPPEAVWSDLEDVAAHVEWMADAVAIRFLGDQRRGVGTRFECDTRVGPITVTD
ncbi:SRPBCC family protein, partial [Salmonella enterica]|uniref:SRPBCC family protein n=1 Tax=Salmonella enterica TaxID=28901 RepID=UPI00329A1347